MRSFDFKLASLLTSEKIKKLISSVFFPGTGEMSDRTRAFNWSETSIGAFENWPQSLKTTVSNLLLSEFPMFLFWGPDLIQFYNDAYRPSLGHSGKHPTALGQRGIDTWPEIWATIYPIIQQVMTTGKAYFVEDSLIPINRNGRLENVYWTFSYSAVIGEAGEIAGVLVVCNETTKKVESLQEIERSKELIRVSDERFRNLVREATAAIIVLTGTEMKVEVVNEAYSRLLNLKPEDLLDKPLFSVIPDAEEYYMPFLRKVLETGEPVTLHDSPYSVVTNGVPISGFLHVVYQPYRNDEGKILGVMAIIQDVTESVKFRNALEDSETRFRSLIEHAPIATCLYVGRELRVEVANDIMLQYWGKDRSEVIDKPLSDGVPELKGQPFLKILDNVFTSGKTHVARGEPAQLRINGELRTAFFDYTYKPLFDKNGNVYGVMNMANDVTEQWKASLALKDSENLFRNLSGRLEEEVDERTKELKQSNWDLQQFAHVASHDLKEPVRKIKTFANRLQAEKGEQLDSTANTYLDKIQNATDRMGAMIDGVLAYSGISSLKLPTQIVDLNSIIENIKSDLEVLIQETQGKIITGDLPQVGGAPVLLYQLFYNLINNSLKFKRENVPPVVEIKSEFTEIEGAKAVRITVNDNGIGFEQQFSERIFETFIRLNTKDKFEGTGLGLALCKNIVSKHGGSIHAIGSRGNGASFIVTLPIKQQNEI